MELKRASDCGRILSGPREIGIIDRKTVQLEILKLIRDRGITDVNQVAFSSGKSISGFNCITVEGAKFKAFNNTFNIVYSMPSDQGPILLHCTNPAGGIELFYLANETHAKLFSSSDVYKEDHHEQQY